MTMSPNLFFGGGGGGGVAGIATFCGAMPDCPPRITFGGEPLTELFSETGRDRNGGPLYPS